eukprot:TRINITY_DN10107_c0_g1_i1.p1 TRINITY_DN10107_c0_g1~~TRINITY_DN10107_c0_g1_i1.p1  ORF type:complete len:336 (+),score=115.65 TRINITY_DN10107_c0_g1_i1:88-1008(+)
MEPLAEPVALQARDVFMQEEVLAEDLDAEYPLCAPHPPPNTAGVAFYSKGFNVSFVKPQARIVDDNIKNIKSECAYAWADDHSVFSMGHPGRVIDHIETPTMPDVIHVVELVTSAATGNVVMAPPDALGPACWKGQYVMLSDVSKRLDGDDEVRDLFPVINPCQWAPATEVRPFRTGRVAACIPRGEDTLCLVRLEPPGPPDTHYCVFDVRHTGDAAQWSKSVRQPLLLEGGEVTDMSSGEPVKATHIGMTTYALPRPFRGTEQLHVLRYPQKGGLKRKRDTAYGTSYDSVSMVRADLMATEVTVE